MVGHFKAILAIINNNNNTNVQFFRLLGDLAKNVANYFQVETRNCR